MSCGEQQQGSLVAAGFARCFATLIKPPQSLGRNRRELPAGFGQLHTMRGPVEQRGTNPLFKRPDAPTEGGLGDIPYFRSAREIFNLRERNKIFEPTQFHGGHAANMIRAVMGVATRCRSLQGCFG